MNDLIARLVRLDWQQNFDSRTLAKGFDYVVEDRVQIVEVAALHLLARCIGSGSNIYTVRLYLSEKDPQWTDLNCLCSCPVEFDCKHAAAVLFKALTVEDQLGMPQDASGDRLNPQIEQWLNTIPAAAPQVDSLPTRSTTCLLYQLQPDYYANRWSLAVFQARTLKKGGFSGIKALYSLDETVRRAPGYMLELDRRIGRLSIAGAFLRWLRRRFPSGG